MTPPTLTPPHSATLPKPMPAMVRQRSLPSRSSPTLTFPTRPVSAVGTSDTQRTLHLTSSLSPTWQLDLSGTAKRSNFTRSGCKMSMRSSTNPRFYSPPVPSSRSGLHAEPDYPRLRFRHDAEKTVNFHGQHTLSVGWGTLTRSIQSSRAIVAALPLPLHQHYCRIPATSLVTRMS